MIKFLVDYINSVGIGTPNARPAPRKSISSEASGTPRQLKIGGIVDREAETIGKTQRGRPRIAGGFGINRDR
jgi:hypothetical protein